jgi:hypothetical protein
MALTMCKGREICYCLLSNKHHQITESSAESENKKKWNKKRANPVDTKQRATDITLKEE